MAAVPWEYALVRETSRSSLSMKCFKTRASTVSSTGFSVVEDESWDGPAISFSLLPTGGTTLIEP